MNKKLNIKNFIIKVIVVAGSVYILFSSLIPNFTYTARQNIEETRIEKQIEKEVVSRSNIDLQKQIMKDRLESAKSMITQINSDVEYILATVNGSHSVHHSKSPEDNWNDILVDSSVELKTEYQAILSIPSDKVVTSIDKSGTVILHYDTRDIEVKSVEIKSYTTIFDTKLFGKKYTNDELIGLIELAQNEIRNDISHNKDLIHSASKTLESHMKQMGEQFNIYAINFNNKYTENIKGYEYIDSGNVKYGHPNKHKTEPIKYIVIHSTSNPNVDAEAHVSYLNNVENSNAANYYIDYDSIQNTLDDEMYPYHTGNSINNESIGIELCEFDDINKQLQTIHNASDLIHMLQEKYPDAEVVMHKQVSDWGKNCPSIVYGNNPKFTEKELIDLLLN